MTALDHHRQAPHTTRPTSAGGAGGSAVSQVHSRDGHGIAQYPPVGSIPPNSRLLLSALLWADTSTVLSIGQLVQASDLDEPHNTVYAAVLACAHAGQGGPRLVLDRIIRVGDASQLVRDELGAATTAGGVPEALPHYAAQILADHFRRAVESYGTGLVGWSATASEAELWEHIVSGGTRLRGLHDRLAAARKGAGHAHD